MAASRSLLSSYFAKPESQSCDSLEPEPKQKGRGRTKRAEVPPKPILIQTGLSPSKTKGGALSLNLQQSCNNKEPRKKKPPPPLKKLKEKLNVKKNEFRIIDNPEKKLHESWGDAKHPITENKINLYNFPKPFRATLVSKPNGGKSTAILNILAHLDPPPAEVFLLHQKYFNPNIEVNQATHYPTEEFEDADAVIDEYKDINATILKTIPNENYFIDKECNKKHTVFVMDDCALKEWTHFNRGNLTLLNKLFSYMSTHYNLSILSAFQCIYQQAEPCVYRYSNIFVLFKPTDLLLIGKWANNCGLTTPELKALIKYCKTSHDCIVLDLTNNSPAPYRLNFTTVVSFL